MKMKERVFTQKFDIIATKKRMVLDIEKDKYPGETVQFFLNGTTGELSTSLEDVVRENVPYSLHHIDDLHSSRKGYSAEYDKEQKKVFIHMLVRDDVKKMRRGTKITWTEFGRFAIGPDRTVYKKPEGFEAADRSSAYCNVEHYKEKLKNDEQYFCNYGKSGLPFTPSNFESVFDSYVNFNNGSGDGFMKEISNIMPPVFNQTGNDYIPITDYSSLFEYFKAMDNGVTCTKKSGKKQDYIDEMVKFELPEVEAPKMELEKFDIYKFAKIQKVEGANVPTCVIRTFNYIPKDDVLFEGGRIYVTKKSAEFCKKNNAGEYVAQPLLSKVHHWDFEIDKFPEDETKGTMLEYFGQVVSKIDPENRAIAIWMFLKEPFLESLAKLSSIKFLDKFIDDLRYETNLDNVYEYSLGVTKRDAKKVFQALGISKQQFESLKDILDECMPHHIWCGDRGKERDTLTWGVIPFLKGMLVGTTNGDISSIDINTFNKYLDFSINTFSVYDTCKKYVESNNAIIKLLELRDMILRIFPTFQIEKLFDVFTQLVFNEAKAHNGYYYNDLQEFRMFNDYLTMANRLDDKNEYKPEFSSVEDMKVMHDNLSVIMQVSQDRWIAKDFETRHVVWQEWEFKQEEKKDKNGEIKQEALPFMVIAPVKPTDLAREGTILHHCVKSYIERVAEGKTNILFIRKVDEPDTPFFTVEVSNEKQIEQVHGFANRNADTEPGLEDFVKQWAAKKRLKIHGINKVR